MSNEPNYPAPTIDEIRLAKGAAEVKIAQAVHEAATTFYRETGLSIVGINVSILPVSETIGRVRSYGLGGIEIEVERI